jgi:protein TonB
VRRIGLILAFFVTLLLAVLTRFGTANDSTRVSIKGDSVSATPEVVDDFITIEGEPILIKWVKPIYPDSARKAGIEGTVVVRVLIDTLGQVLEVQIQKPSGLNVGFEDAAFLAAKKCKWQPASYLGKKQQVWVAYPVKFSLHPMGPNINKGKTPEIKKDS